jgi:UBX domain-containing protein 1/4
MTTADLDMLIDMGFDRERAQMAMSESGGLQDAITWLEKNQDKSIEDIRAENESAAQEKAAEAEAEAKSLVCNECGKKFKGTTSAEFHATKSGHTDFSESTEEIAPLTEEEKAQKLADLREKLAAKRAAQSEQDKIDQKRNEQISRKKTKETEDMKEQLRIKEQIKDAEKKRAEKQADIDAKKRIQAKIAADKEERRLKAEREKAERAGRALPVEPVAAAPAPSKAAADYKETRLRLQTANGNIMKTFPVDTTLFEVAAAVGDELGRDVESFTQNFPKKVFTNEFFGETLKELKLVPSASLIVK